MQNYSELFWIGQRIWCLMWLSCFLFGKTAYVRNEDDLQPTFLIAKRERERLLRNRSSRSSMGALTRESCKNLCEKPLGLSMPTQRCSRTIFISSGHLYIPSNRSLMIDLLQGELVIFTKFWKIFSPLLCHFFQIHASCRFAIRLRSNCHISRAFESS